MPFVKDGTREYRNFNTAFSVVESSDSSNAYTVEGYATTFEPYDFGCDGWKEQILPTALRNADMSDVIFQLNHEGATLARQRNNSLQLSIDEHGLFVRAYLGGSQNGRDLFEAISNGLIDKMSWGFAVDWENGIDYDYESRMSTVKNVIKVFDVSAVSIPANDDTEIHARSYIDGVIDAQKQQELLQRKQKEQRLRKAALLKMNRL